jgi:integrase
LIPLRFRLPVISIRHSKSTPKFANEGLREKVILRIFYFGARVVIDRYPRHCRWFISSEFTKVCRKVGVPNFVFHCLRHTFAARLLGRGVPIYKVSKILGHPGVQVTEQHCGHLNQGGPLRRDKRN